MTKHLTKIKPVYGYMVARGALVDETSFEYDRDPLVKRLNRPSGERVVMVRISQVDKIPVRRSWYCDQCAVEVYDRRCQHCGKLKGDKT